MVLETKLFICFHRSGVGSFPWASRSSPDYAPPSAAPSPWGARQESPLAGIFVWHKQTIPFCLNDTWLNICLPNHAPSAAYIPLTKSKTRVCTEPGHSVGNTGCSEPNSFTPNSIDSLQLRVVKHVFVSKLRYCDSDIDTQGAVTVCTVTQCHI